MRCDIVGVYDLLQVIRPSILLLSWENPQQAVHRTVEPLHLTIPSGVVRSGVGLLGVVHGTQLANQR